MDEGERILSVEDDPVQSDRASIWTLAMTIAWIATRHPLHVQECWDDFLRERGELPSDISLVSIDRLDNARHLRATRALWRELENGNLLATAIDRTGAVCSIPKSDWRYLKWVDERGADVLRRSLTGPTEYRDIKFSRADVLRIFKSDSELSPFASQDDSPPANSEEARLRSVRPPLSKFDPMQQSHWSIMMTLAWIAWRRIDAVREQWDDYRAQCKDWLFWGDPAALAELNSIAANNLASGEIAPNNPDLDLRLKKGSWELTPKMPSNWHSLALTALEKAPVLDVQTSQTELWRAAGEAKISATALECESRTAISGIETSIKPYSWSRLAPDCERCGKASLVSVDDRSFRDVKFARIEVLELWPAPSEGVPSAANSSSGAPGRPTSMHLVENEFRRRMEEGSAEHSNSAESEILAEWLATTHPNEPRPTAKTIRNRIGPIRRAIASARN